MGVDPQWFADERSIGFVRMYLFYRSDPSKAFPVSFNEQPAIWVQAKQILDGVFAELRWLM
jgi:hypothetical protein